MEAMRRTPIILASLLVALTACRGPDHALRIDVQGSKYPTTFFVDVADTPEARAQGLMGREWMDQTEGMVFLIDSPTQEGFWMKDTLIPLSIAFWGKDRRIFAIMDMDPCKVGPCPVYRPGAPYVGAIEVNQGMLGAQGVAVGDKVDLGFAYYA